LTIGSGSGGGNVPATSKLVFGPNNSVVTFLSANDSASVDGEIGAWNTVYNHQNSKIVFDKNAGNTGQLLFYTQGGSGITERMRIDSSGNVGVGTTTPSSYGKLASVGTNTSSALLAVRDEGTSTGNLFIVSTNSIGTIARINSYGIGIGGATPSSGMGISFPATQSASSDANTLDDYEEGEFTPLMNGVSLGTQNYVKIGQFVYININAYSVNVSSIGATTLLNVSGLPFVKRTGLFVLVIDQYPSVPVTLGDGTSTSSNLYTTANATDYNFVTRNSYGGSSTISFRFVFTYQANA
jgi:hypothetical protein